MKNEPLFAKPAVKPLALSKALETHRAFRGTYSAYRPQKRVACDECVNVLHEAHGVGEPPLSAKHSRRTPTGQLRLCHPHNDLWRDIDGVGKKT